MATFHIGQQSAQQIVNAETIHNMGATSREMAQLQAQLAQLLAEVRRQADEGQVEASRATQAAAEIVAAVEEASQSEPRPGRVRALLAKAAEVLSGVAAASAVVTSLEAIVGALPVS